MFFGNGSIAEEEASSVQVQGDGAREMVFLDGPIDCRNPIVPFVHPGIESFQGTDRHRLIDAHTQVTEATKSGHDVK